MTLIAREVNKNGKICPDCVNCDNGTIIYKEINAEKALKVLEENNLLDNKSLASRLTADVRSIFFYIKDGKLPGYTEDDFIITETYPCPLNHVCKNVENKNEL